MPLPSLEPLSAAAGRRLVECLRGLGLDREFIRARTQPLDNLRRPLEARREARYSPEARDRALRLFFCGEPLPAGEVEEAWLRTGLLEPAAPGYEFPFHLRTVQNLYLVSDYLREEPDAVMGAGETTAILYRAARPARRVASILDVGCGAGTLALLLASDADRALGVDLNPRAVAIARFNAAANGVANAEFRCGDLFAPAAGERFDLIVAQPPYYPRPERGEALVFLHGGERGDELALRCVEEAPALLSPAGVAMVFATWSEGRVVPAGVREFFADRSEVGSGRQSLTLVDRRPRGFRRRIANETWGSLDAAVIARCTRAEDAAALPDAQLASTPVRRTPGWTVLEDGDPVALSHAVFGTQAVPADLWARPEAGLREALRRGLLEPV
jgi:SAM-dependent methyltransferase